MVPAFDIDVVNSDCLDPMLGLCAGIECRVWALDAESPGAPVPDGASCTIHFAECTNFGPYARFHLQLESFGIEGIGFCVRQLYADRSPSECVYPFGDGVGSDPSLEPPIHREEFP